MQTFLNLYMYKDAVGMLQPNYVGSIGGLGL